MSRSIKVSDDVFRRIQRLQGPRETYSEVIDRCLSTVEALRTLPVGPREGHYIKERIAKGEG